jgi:CubicO group peptidase (beta-lactamase class C family)
MKLRGLGSRAEFLARLAAVCAHKRPQFLSVALRAAGWTALAETDSAGVPRVIEESQATPVPAGCLTKPITASLLAGAVAAGEVDWNTEVSHLLRVRGEAQGKLSRVRLGHLLDHSHGLDSLAEVVPRTSGGLVDVPLLCAQLASRPLSEPGELYSYGNIGAWLGGAVLERISGKRYSQLLAESSLTPLDGHLQHPPMCPASGDCLQLTTAQWLAFLERHLRPGDETNHEAAPESERCSSLVGLPSLLTQRIKMPGWSPAEQAACIGWKYYGAGWYGHNANMTSCSALLRFNPREGTALAMAGAGDTTFLMLAGVFGTLLPELANLRIPRLLVSGAEELFESAPYVGRFSRARTHIEVATASQRRLSFTFGTTDSEHAPIHGRLRRAENEVFFPDSRVDYELPFLQFVRSKHSPGFDYLWNGKQLWRRD